MKKVVEDHIIDFEEKENWKYNAPHNFSIKINNTDLAEVGNIHFQEGPIKEAGYNGVREEDLLSIIQTRLEAFQNSEYACEENAKALEHVKYALGALKDRTAKRQARNVEGTSSI